MQGLSIGFIENTEIYSHGTTKLNKNFLYWHARKQFIKPADLR